MKTPRLNGSSEKFGPVSTSEEFLTWEIPDRESSARMRRLIDGMGRASLVLDASKYPGLKFDGASSASFIDKEEFSRGRDESAHQVRFGQLLLNGRDFYEVPEFVAVKPFALSDRASLYREWAAHEYLNSLTNRQIGYINLGVHNDHDGVESIISQYDHGVTTFDSSFWADVDDPGAALRPNVLRRHALLGAEGIGFMHGAGVTHGDAQVKNLGADRLGFRTVDLETAEIIEPEVRGDTATVKQTGHDIDVFVDSMGMVEENREKIIEAFRAESIRERVANAYVRGVRAGKHASGEKTAGPDYGKINRDRIHHQLGRLVGLSR